MAVEGEWAWPNCIGCGKRLDKKRPRDFRYGMDVCCASCMKRVMSSEGYRIAWAISSAAQEERWLRKRENHGEWVSGIVWHKLAKDYALAWAELRRHFDMPWLPAGLELFLVEIHNVRI